MCGDQLILIVFKQLSGGILAFNRKAVVQRFEKAPASWDSSSVNPTSTLNQGALLFPPGLILAFKAC